MKTINLLSAINYFTKTAQTKNYTVSYNNKGVEVRDRFQGVTGEDRQKLLQEDAAKKGYTLVETKKTPLNKADVINSLRKIVDSKFPNLDDAEKQTFVHILYSQIKLETGLKYCYNWNVGNVHAYGKQFGAWKGKVSAWDDPQIDKSGKAYINKDWLWRAYDNLDEAISDWYGFLERKIPNALNYARAGDIEKYVYELKNKGYFTADVNKYLAGMKAVNYR